MTYYLKYRPQNISELDLKQVRETLTRILSEGARTANDIPHAFLFSGPRGAGKTSAARIVAKVLNCETLNVKGKTSNESVEPCGKCTQCTEIANGSSLDVIEIDAASNRGVDDIRHLREGVKLSPATASKKVYIIDEAHMLTTEASNALLKTLEEPPSHVVFILATTNPGKLLDTIRSRCTNVVFPKAAQEEVVESLNKAVKGEKLKVEDGVLEQIAKSVDGSFREAHKILEQISIGREKVTLEDLGNTASFSLAATEKLLEHLKNGDVAGALSEVDAQISGGTDPKQYAVGVVSALRQILLSEFVPALQGSSLRGYKVAEFGGVEKVKEAIELFSKASLEVSSCPIPQLPIELAVVGCIADRSESLRSSNNSPRSALEEKKEKEKEDPKVEALPQEKVKSGSDAADAGQVKGEELEQKWKIVMQTVKPKNHSIEALLRATRPKAYDGKTLTLEVFYNFHKERIEKDPYRSLVEEIAEQVLGAPVILNCHLSTDKQKAVDSVNVTETVEEDIVRAAEDIFGASSEDANKLPN